MARLGGADDGAHPAEGAAPRKPRGEIVDDLRQALVQRRLRRRQVLDVGGAGVAGADEGEHPGSGSLGPGQQRLERVAAQQRVDGEGVDPEPRDGPPRGRGLTNQGLGVGGGADRNVAALAVGDDQEPLFTRGLADLCQRRPAGGAEALEAGELGLDGDAGGAGPLDQLAALGGDRRSGLLGGPAGDILRSLARAELGRVRVEAETDLAAALFDERREPIRKWDQGRFSP